MNHLPLGSESTLWPPVWYLRQTPWTFLPVCGCNCRFCYHRHGGHHRNSLVPFSSVASKVKGASCSASPSKFFWLPSCWILGVLPTSSGLMSPAPYQEASLWTAPSPWDANQLLYGPFTATASLRVSVTVWARASPTSAHLWSCFINARVYRALYISYPCISGSAISHLVVTLPADNSLY